LTTISDPPIFIRELTFCKVQSSTNGPDMANIWQISGGPRDVLRDRPVLHAEEDTLLEAWRSILEQARNVQECSDCGFIAQLDKGGCQQCEVRHAFGLQQECGICNQEKDNIYRLLCGHSLCRQCAKRCSPRRCPFGCTRTFRLVQGLEEMICECGQGDCDEHDDA
jgi:hypothetical protein